MNINEIKEFYNISKKYRLIINKYSKIKDENLKNNHHLYSIFGEFFKNDIEDIESIVELHRLDFINSSYKMEIYIDIRVNMYYK